MGKQEVLRWAISGDVKMQDFFYLLSGVSGSSKQGLDMAWHFFKSEFDTFHTMLKSGNASIMDAAILNSCNGFCSDEKASEIEKFFEEHPLPQNKRTIMQLLEEMRTNAKFVGRILATDVAKQEYWDTLISSLR